jgi:hypothetical protein
LSSARRDEDDGPAVLSGFSAGASRRQHYGKNRTVEEAMSQIFDWWGDLLPPMKEAIEQFRTQLGAAIDSVEFVKRALDRQVHETDRGKDPV